MSTGEIDRNAPPPTGAFHLEDGGHFLYWGRRRAVVGLLERAGVDLGSSSVLDVGCGTGYVLSALQELGADTTALDMYPSLVALSRERGAPRQVCARAGDLPFGEGRFDVVLSLDVYEHLDCDCAAMAEAFRVVAPGGVHMVFVPAMRSLWSACDEMQGHKRRYRASELRSKLESVGFQVEFLTHLLPGLLAPVFAVRTANKLLPSKKWRHRAALAEYGLPPPWLNGLLRAYMAVEFQLVSRCNVGVGLSAVALARKPAQP